MLEMLCFVIFLPKFWEIFQEFCDFLPMCHLLTPGVCSSRLYLRLTSYLTQCSFTKLHFEIWCVHHKVKVVNLFYCIALNATDSAIDCTIFFTTQRPKNIQYFDDYNIRCQCSKTQCTTEIQCIRMKHVSEKYIWLVQSWVFAIFTLTFEIDSIASDSDNLCRYHIITYNHQWPDYKTMIDDDNQVFGVSAFWHLLKT